MFFAQEGFTYRNFLMDALGIFIFVVWFWLLITVFADLFRRHDISGWIKAIWVIALIVFSYIAVLAYLIFQGRGMAERNVQQAQQAADVPLCVEHCEAVAAEIDVKLRWLGEQARRGRSVWSGAFPRRHVMLEVACEPSVVGSL